MIRRGFGLNLGVFLKLFKNKKIGDALAYVSACGVQKVEIATGGYMGYHHINPGQTLQNPNEIKKIRQLVEKYHLQISALSCHGNPLHPDEEISRRHHEDFMNSILLAKELGVDTVINFSGCPGDSDESKRPVWVTCAWPPDYFETVEWQWKEKVRPYWEEMGEFTGKHGIKIAVEPHPGFVVYNSETFWRLRQAAGDHIGVNFDPSHLFWQGMDPVACILELGDQIFHFHAKDTAIHKRNKAINGVLDTKPREDVLNRSWVFRTVGYGQHVGVWKEIISALRMINYQGTISIEHEDSLMSLEEGFNKAVKFLDELLITDISGEVYRPG